MPVNNITTLDGSGTTVLTMTLPENPSVPPTFWLRPMMKWFDRLKPEGTVPMLCTGFVPP